MDGVWAQALKAAFNTTDAFVIINTTSTPSIVGSSGLISPGTDDLLLAALRRDVRSRLLGTCQHWWYDTFPPNQEAVLVTGFNVTLSVNMSAAPCFLTQQAALAALAAGDDGALGRWYMQLQCATGYAGHICATCEPGYSLTVDFSCMECPPLARTVSIGLLAFWGTVALILFTAFSNLSKNRQEAMQMEELSALDLLKVGGCVCPSVWPPEGEGGVRVSVCLTELRRATLRRERECEAQACKKPEADGKCGSQYRKLGSIVCECAVS